LKKETDTKIPNELYIARLYHKKQRLSGIYNGCVWIDRWPNRL
jgi:hypothetical protein